jgi:hypothetical protein
MALSEGAAPPRPRRVHANQRPSHRDFPVGRPSGHHAHHDRSRTGRLHTVPVLGFPIDEGLIIAAGNFGRREEPAWCLNLRRDLHGQVTMNHQSRRVVAEELLGETRAAVWERCLSIYGLRQTRRASHYRSVPAQRTRRLNLPGRSGAPDHPDGGEGDDYHPQAQSRETIVTGTAPGPCHDRSANPDPGPASVPVVVPLAACALMRMCARSDGS